MFSPRTDLAAEARSRFSGRLEGASLEKSSLRGFPVTDVRVSTEKAAETLCKPIGEYISVDVGRLLRRESEAFQDGSLALADCIRRLMPLEPDRSVLVVGLGNPAITPDAVGHLALKSVLVTYHMKDDPAFAAFRPVAAFEPGVLGTSGVESARTVEALARELRPDALIAVDALAALSTDRLCSTVQLTDTGIVPGSGVGNARQELSSRTLGVPVLAVGVPTVVDAASLCADLLSAAGADLPDLGPAGIMMVTPRDIDAAVQDISKLVGYGIDLALHEGLTCGDLDMLL